MTLHLPDPAAARVEDVHDQEGTVTVQFKARNAAHKEALLTLLEKAERDGYGIELRLIHYEGQPDMIQQAAARKARKNHEQPTLLG